MARYGATVLALDTWYHVAGVYDAAAQTLDVYSNGELDNGFLLGPVTGRQRSSRESLYIGRRSDPAGFRFAGSVDDVRIYSRALTKAEIVADMQGTAIDGGAVQGATAGPADGGLLLLAARAPTSLLLGLWLIPLVSLAGGVSVALSVRRRNDLEISDPAA